MTKVEKSYLGLNDNEAKTLLKRIGAEDFRFEQIHNWIYKNCV